MMSIFQITGKQKEQREGKEGTCPFLEDPNTNSA
jgi:hypothetical protein